MVGKWFIVFGKMVHFFQGNGSFLPGNGSFLPGKCFIYHPEKWSWVSGKWSDVSGKWSVRTRKMRSEPIRAPLRLPSGKMVNGFRKMVHGLWKWFISSRKNSSFLPGNDSFLPGDGSFLPGEWLIYHPGNGPGFLEDGPRLPEMVCSDAGNAFPGARARSESIRAPLRLPSGRMVHGPRKIVNCLWGIVHFFLEKGSLLPGNWLISSREWLISSRKWVISSGNCLGI